MSFFSSFGGGFPFGGHHAEEEQESQEVDNTKFYEVLEISKNASQDQIKKQYRELAKKYHPDRPNGNAGKFKEISEAYETLSDPEKRRMYDKFGTKGPQSDGSDILNMFFGGGRGGQGRGGRPEKAKTKPIKKALDVTLQQCYNGELIKIPHQRVRNCETCKGKGGSEVKTCKPCKGNGRVVQMYQMGPGMYQQVQKACDACQGEGEIIEQGKKCKGCQGKKVSNKQKIIQVPLQRGAFHGHPIQIYGEGNETPETLPGDLIFVVQEQPHEVFKRKGADLFMKKTITLVEALIGFEFKLKHLDGQTYTIYTARGEAIADKDKKVVRGLGMPLFKSQSDFGNLIIDFLIEMPKRGDISKEQLQALATILPGKINERPKGDYNMLEDFDKESVNTSEQGGKKNISQEEQQEQSRGGGGCPAQ